ncbi:hypothetical protein QBC41DRAFT_350973 [Cercophora samala]|uniref:Uncharacterized protein n=1 Tax=Cercophora samala TaxID=330535 RepID=A0AA39YYJ7_9PEZI|nr:hypothetical protein QBC41DRAFT_350973 [Cercophora samala]
MTSKQRLQKKRKAWKERKKAHRKAAANTKASQPGSDDSKSTGVNITPKPEGARPSENNLQRTEERLNQIESRLSKYDLKWTAYMHNLRRQLKVEDAQHEINNRHVGLVAKVGNKLLDEITGLKNTVNSLKESRANDFKDMVVEEMEEGDEGDDEDESEEEELVIALGE